MTCPNGFLEHEKELFATICEAIECSGVSDFLKDVIELVAKIL
jgi:hypothetical protein